MSIKNVQRKMTPKQKWKIKKYISFAGTFIILIPNGIIMTWGNLSVYAMSYLVMVCGESANEQSAWVLCTFIIFWTLVATISSYLSSKIGRRPCLVLGIIFSDVGLFMGYFAVQNSLVALTFTMGVLTGTGTGLLDATALQTILEWADKDAGMLTAADQAALAFGGFITNQLVTLYVNPQNLSPDTLLGRNKFFSQASLLHNVPGIFLIFGSFAFVLHFLGFLLVRPISPEERKQNEEALQLNGTGNTFKEKGIPINDTNERMAILEKPKPETLQQLSPLEMLRTKSFYALWITFFMGTMSMLLVDTYYKSFGQLYIHDDHFLTNLGTVLSISTALVGIILGFIMDRIGVKITLIINIALTCFGSFWYYFSPLPSRWLFFFVSIVLAGLAGSVFSTYTAAVVLLYGPKYFSSNFGITLTSAMLFNIIAPLMFKAIISKLGWYLLFIIGGVLNLMRLVVVMVCIPQI